MTQELVKDWQYVVVAEVPAACVIVYKIVFFVELDFVEGTHDMASTMRVAGDVRS